MALIKETQTKFGISASYWKIGYISIDRINKYGSVSLNLFFTKDSKEYIESYTEIMETPEEFDTYFGTTALQTYRDMYQCGYEFIKMKSIFFKDAISDDIEN